MDLLGRMTSRKSPVHKYCMDTTSKPGPSVEPFGTRKIMMGVPSGKYDTVFALRGKTVDGVVARMVSRKA